MHNNYLVIMAGGVGSRFWPLSTAQKPKQFLDILNVGQTLLQQTVERFSGCCPASNVFVVTSAHYRNLVLEQLPHLPPSQLLLEPCMRNTAPCIAYAVWKIKKRNPLANIVVSPSDHLVLNPSKFRDIVNQCLHFTAENEALLTLGIEPHKPETGYGYIKQEPQPVGHGAIRKVEAFKEKPHVELARQYLADGNYFWNSGIFIWSVAAIEQGIRNYMPELASLFDSLDAQLDTPEEWAAIEAAFPLCPNISIDYGLLERAPNIYVYPSEFGWSDLGTWGSLHEQSAQSAEGNVLKGRIRTFETRNSIVRIDTDRQVVVQGLDGYIVVETDEALLICKREEEQRIKEFMRE